jgi:hypothetical protein
LPSSPVHIIATNSSFLNSTTTVHDGRWIGGEETQATPFCKKHDANNTTMSPIARWVPPTAQDSALFKLPPEILRDVMYFTLKVRPKRKTTYQRKLTNLRAGMAV